MVRLDVKSNILIFNWLNKISKYQLSYLQNMTFKSKQLL